MWINQLIVKPKGRNDLGSWAAIYAFTGKKP